MTYEVALERNQRILFVGDAGIEVVKLRRFMIRTWLHEEIEVEGFKELYYDTCPQQNSTAVRDWRHGCPTVAWASTDDAIVQSGLLAAAPDGVGLSLWGFDEVEGFPALAPFLSLRCFGWMNIADGRYEDATRCFLHGLGDLERFGPDDSIEPPKRKQTETKKQKPP